MHPTCRVPARPCGLGGKQGGSVFLDWQYEADIKGTSSVKHTAHLLSAIKCKNVR